VVEEEDERGASKTKLKPEKQWSKQGQGVLVSLVEKMRCCSGDGKVALDLHAPSCNG